MEMDYLLQLEQILYIIQPMQLFGLQVQILQEKINHGGLYVMEIICMLRFQAQLDLQMQFIHMMALFGL